MWIRFKQERYDWTTEEPEAMKRICPSWEEDERTREQDIGDDDQSIDRIYGIPVVQMKLIQQRLSNIKAKYTKE